MTAPAKLDHPTESGERGASPSRFRALLSNPGAVFGFIILGIIVVGAVGANFLAPFNPDAQNLAVAAMGPSSHHLLGTDELGRDTLSRLLYGARSTLWASCAAVIISLVIGVALGLVAGYWRGLLESLIMRVMDVILGFPSFLLAIILVAVLGPSLQNAAIAIGIAGIPSFARLVGGSVRSIREREFVLGALGSGASHLRVMVRYILPNLVSTILVFSTLSLGNAVLSIAGLSFLGLGAQPPTSEWGLMVQNGVDYLNVAPYIVLAPGLAIVLFVLAVNLLGDALQDCLNPGSSR